jgi:arsenate reductase
MKTILFACVHNAGRSQMAAALFNQRSDPAKARAVSAGTEPGERVHPEVVDAMKELGVDLSTARPQKLTEGLAATVDMLVTMGCGETCPVVPGIERHDWPLADPKGKSTTEVGAIRDEIEQRVQALLAARSWGRISPELAIDPATRDDERAVRALLADAGLPLEGLEVGFPSGYAIARRGGVMVGCAGLETHDRDGLLRSVAVSGSERGNGIGAVLVADRVSAAKRAGLGVVYLLTTTAPEFFRRLGFESCERGTVPRAVQSSAEFAEICPATAACMRLAVK